MPPNMIRKEIKVEFVTPAFLGSADQAGEWRVPPFKALLRQWWRIARARDLGYDTHQLREEEGKLFGHAWLKHNGDPWSIRSSVQLRLSRWQPGTLGAWIPQDPKVKHPEVEMGGGQVGSHLYLGYGPLIYGGGTRLKRDPACNAGELATLGLRYPKHLDSSLTSILRLCHWFGAVGGRSRNAWGSIRLASGPAPIPSRNDLAPFLRPWTDCMKLEWPHAIGSSPDGRPLVWTSRTTFTKWEDAMKHLAELKIGFRTSMGFNGPGLSMRHFLGYPITHHNLPSLGNAARLASQLRFKVVAENPQNLRCVAFHVPHKLPPSMRDALHAADKPKVEELQRNAWQTVHQFLMQRMEQLT